MTKSKTDDISDDVLEQRTRDIIADFDSNGGQQYGYFSEPEYTDIAEVWNQLLDLHGPFKGIEEVAIDPEIERDIETNPNERVVEASTYFGDEPFKIQAFYTEGGEPVGFYLIRDKEVGVKDAASDIKRIAESKIQSVGSLIGGSSNSITDEEREIVKTVVQELDDGEYSVVYDRLSEKLQGQVTAPQIKAAWTEHVSGFQGIGSMKKKDGVIQATLECDNGTTTLFVLVADGGSLDTLRIRDFD